MLKINIDIMSILTFKMQCVAKQQDIGVKLNIPLIKEELINLEDLKVQKIEILTKAMPKVPVKAKKEMPKVLRKADGSLSANGYKWFEFLKKKWSTCGNIYKYGRLY